MTRLSIITLGAALAGLVGCQAPQGADNSLYTVEPVVEGDDQPANHYPTLSLDGGGIDLGPVGPEQTQPAGDKGRETAARNDIEIEPVASAEPVLALARKLKDEGDLRSARAAFTQVLDMQAVAAEEAEALHALDAINLTLFNSSGEGGDMDVYTVQSGDTLSKIADVRGTTWQFLRRANELNGNRIRVGQQLKVPRGKLSLIVRKNAFVMDLMLDGDFIKRYTVGLGLKDCTPEGEFAVTTRIPKPQDGMFAYGDPKHRLGTHWLGLKSGSNPELKGYGIHGCPAEKYGEIGGPCSQGCVRVTNENVEELFEILPIGTSVVIVR